MKKALIITAAVATLIPLVVTAAGQGRQVVATTRSEWIKFNPVTPLTAATFANPPATDLPWVRLNMPASADPAEIQVEVQQMRDAGIAGIEVGQGAFPNNEQLVALLTAANQGGIKVSLSHGPTQNPAGLKAWPEIPQLQHVSGIASYTTRFDLPARWNARHGATLELGQVFDAFTVAVNGQAVSIDQISAEGDVGPYLKAGANTITVRVATTLNNRLANLDSDVANRGIVQPHGLVGPVVLTPYSQATVWK